MHFIYLLKFAFTPCPCHASWHVNASNNIGLTLGGTVVGDPVKVGLNLPVLFHYNLHHHQRSSIYLFPPLLFHALKYPARVGLYDMSAARDSSLC